MDYIIIIRKNVKIKIKRLQNSIQSTHVERFTSRLRPNRTAKITRDNDPFFVCRLRSHILNFSVGEQLKYLLEVCSVVLLQLFARVQAQWCFI